MASPAAASAPALLDNQFLRQARPAFFAAAALAVASAVVDLAVLATGPERAISLSGSGPLLMLHSRMVRVIPAPQRREYEEAFHALASLLFGIQICLGGLGLVFAGSQNFMSRFSARHEGKGTAASSRVPAGRRDADHDPQSGSEPAHEATSAPLQPFLRSVERTWARSDDWAVTRDGFGPQLRVVEVLSAAVCGLVLSLFLILPTIYLARHDGTVLVHTGVSAPCFDAGSPLPGEDDFDPACADPAIRYVLIAPHVFRFYASGATFAMLAGALRPGASFSWACPYLVVLCTLVGSVRLLLPAVSATDAAVNAIGVAIALFVLSLVGRAWWQAPGEDEPVSTPSAALPPSTAPGRSPTDVRVDLQRDRAVAVLATRRSSLRALSTTAPLQLALLVFEGLSCSVGRCDVWAFRPANRAAFYLITASVGATYLTCALWLRLRILASELRARLIRVARDEEDLNSWEDHRAVLLYLCHETRLPMGTLDAALAETRLRLSGAASSVRTEVESAQRRGRHRASHVAEFSTTVQGLLAEAESQCATVDGAMASVRGAMRRSLHGQGADLDPTRDKISLPALSALLERTTSRIAAAHGIRLGFERRGALGTPASVWGVAPTHALDPVLCDETKILELIGILVYNAVRHSTPPAGVSVALSARVMRPSAGLSLSPPHRRRRRRRFSGQLHGAGLSGPPADASTRQPAPSLDVELLCEVEDQGVGLSPAKARHLAAMGIHVRASRIGASAAPADGSAEAKQGEFSEEDPERGRTPGSSAGSGSPAPDEETHIMPTRSALHAAVEIAREHGGLIGCSSGGEGKGSSFWAVLTLPLVPDSDESREFQAHVQHS